LYSDCERRRCNGRVSCCSTAARGGQTCNIVYTIVPVHCARAPPRDGGGAARRRRQHPAVRVRGGADRGDRSVAVLASSRTVRRVRVFSLIFPRGIPSPPNGLDDSSPRPTRLLSVLRHSVHPTPVRSLHHLATHCAQQQYCLLYLLWRIL